MSTAVAAPEESFERLFETIDVMSVLELCQFLQRLEYRFDVQADPYHEREPHVGGPNAE
jgi:ribosomal protein L7/L12